MQLKNGVTGTEKYYKKILDLSPDPIGILQKDQVIYLNTTFTKKFGYSIEELSQKNSFFKLVQDKDKDGLRHTYEKRLKGKRSSQFYRIDLVAKNGAIIPCESSTRLVPFYDEPVIMIIMRIVTERVQIEKSLEGANKRLSMALKASKSGIWDWNLKTGEVFFGENYFNMAGYQKNEFVHSYEEWKKRVHKDDIEKTENIIKAYIRGESEEYLSEFRFKTKDNDWMWILSQGKVYENDGHPLRFTGTHLDITKQKKIELALKESYKTLEEKVEERTSELKEMNSALNILLKKRDEDKNDIEEKIFANFKLCLSPTITRLKKNLTQKTHQSMIDILESELKSILSSFSQKLSDPMMNLTPMEIQIASMIRLGKSNKEISKILNRSAYTIANHRENMRKKLGLQNKKINLRSFLSTL